MDRTAKEIIPSLIRGKSWAKYHTVFSDVSFSITQGEAVAFVGKNGAGKSTLLKLIAGVTYPSSGEVIINGKVAPLIELGAGFHHELTGYENIFLNAAILGMHKAQIEQKVDSIVEFSELGDFIYVPVKRYSTGMLMRLAFSVAVQTDAPIVLIDEVLAVGDVQFQKKCLNYLMELKKKHNRTFIFVSHAQKQVEQFCDRALLLHDGKVLVDGSTHDVFAQYNQLQDKTLSV